MTIRKKSLATLLLFVFYMKAAAQSTDLPDYRTEQLESEAEKKEAEPEDDSYEMDLEQFSKHHLNLNAAAEEELIQLHLLDVFEIRNFIAYRKLLGLLLTIHELQAVPGWDIETIRKLLPYIMVGRD